MPADGAHASVSGLSITPNAGGTGIRVLDSPSSTRMLMCNLPSAQV